MAQERVVICPHDLSGSNFAKYLYPHPHCKPHQLLKNDPECVKEQAGAPGVSGVSAQGQRQDTCQKPCCMI